MINTFCLLWHHLPTRTTIPTLRARLGTTEIPIPTFHGHR
jgi:hypothetical protein